MIQSEAQPPCPARPNCCTYVSISGGIPILRMSGQFIPNPNATAAMRTFRQDEVAKFCSMISQTCASVQPVKQSTSRNSRV